MADKLYFLLLAIGEVLKVDEYVTAEKLQNFVANEEAFGGFRVPLGECRTALDLMERSGFIIYYSDGQYMRDRHLIKESK